MKDIVDKLFPYHAGRSRPLIDAVQEDGIPLFTQAELKTVATTFKNRKLEGPDGIHSEAIKAAAEVCRELKLDMFKRRNFSEEMESSSICANRQG